MTTEIRTRYWLLKLAKGSKSERGRREVPAAFPITTRVDRTFFMLPRLDRLIVVCRLNSNTARTHQHGKLRFAAIFDRADHPLERLSRRIGRQGVPNRLPEGIVA
jgi:hypothetical protein